jgi:hypothetical protein
MSPGSDDNPVTFLLWWYRPQMTKFYPLRNWNACPVIGQDNANFMVRDWPLASENLSGNGVWACLVV